MSHIACLDASVAEDEPGLVEEGARSPSLILNSLHLNLQSVTHYSKQLQPAAALAPAAAADAAAEDGGGGGEAAGDGILMMGSDDEAAPDPPASQPAGDGGPGAA